MLLNENLPRSMPEVRAASLESVPCSGYLSPQGDFDARALTTPRAKSGQITQIKGRVARDDASNASSEVVQPIERRVFFSSSCFKASRLKLAPFCIGGKSSKVCAACAILSTRGWSALKISVAQILHGRADDVIELCHPGVRNRPAEASIGLRAHVRFLSLADKTLCRRDFRFVPKADIRRGKWNVR